MKVLELFSGTGSAEKVCKSLNWESVSVDKFLPADYFVDILDFDYKQYPKNHFDIVWASPPCQAYSRLQNSWIGRRRQGETFTLQRLNEMINLADRLVLKTIEIIEYFNPKYWFIENPQTGKLKCRPFMKSYHYYDVDYCMYSDWGYRKRTRIWTNRLDFEPKKCNHSKHDRQVVPSKRGTKGINNLLDRYRVPENLILDLFNCK